MENQVKVRGYVEVKGIFKVAAVADVWRANGSRRAGG